MTVYFIGLPRSSVILRGSPAGETSSTLILRNFPSRAVFVSSLWRKAGLEPGAWPDGLRVFSYQVIELSE